MNSEFIKRLRTIHYEISHTGKRGVNDDPLLIRIREIKDKWANKKANGREQFNSAFERHISFLEVVLLVG